MKTYISFIILSCIALTLSVTTGRKLKCADDLKIKACYLPNTDTSGVRTTYVKSCSKGKFCRETRFNDGDDDISHSQNIGICVKTIKLGNEGDKCEADAECKWGPCKDSKCTAKKDGDSCSDDDECYGISYCKGLKTDGETITVGICTKLVENGGECTKDNDCAWGSICNLNKCVQKYSLADGVAADNKEACQGGEKLSDTCASDSEKNNTCDVDHYCVYSRSSGTVTEDARYPCDQDKDGNYVCPLVESSDEKQS